MKKESKSSLVITIGFFSFLVFFSLLSGLLPDKELAKTERRYYAKMPKLSIKTIADKSFMEDLESYLLDHFAGRETFRRIKTSVETTVFGKKDANQYVLFDGYLMELDTSWKKGSLSKTAEVFGELEKDYFTDACVYYAVIPDKTSFLPEGAYPDTEEEWVLLELAKHFKQAEYIDLYPYLSLEDYYQTDLHFRQEKVLDVAETLLKQMDAKNETIPYETFLVTDQFLGGYAGASAYFVKEESMYAVSNAMIGQARVYDYETQQETGVYALDKLEGMDPYDYYLSGARALLTIKNEQVSNGKKLLLFRDSFGSSIAPLLLEGYEEITLVDLRYISKKYLETLIDLTAYEDVLFLYSQRVLHHTDSFKL